MKGQNQRCFLLARGSGPRSGARGTVLIVAMLLAAVIGISLVSYVKLTTKALALSHRTFFADNASNLAETGLELAVSSFNQMGNGVAAATAWSGWTLSSSTNEAKCYWTTNQTDTASSSWTVGGSTLTIAHSKFDSTLVLDQNATGVVRVYVQGYDTSNPAPVVIAKATITPFDGSAPVEKTIEVTLQFSGPWANGVIAKNGISWNGHPTADSFVSGTSMSGPFVTYSSGISRSNTSLADLAGAINLGSGGTVDGNVMLGSGVTVSGGTVTGNTTTGFTGNFSLPAKPTPTTYYTLATMPSVLPRAGDSANSADGKYYYRDNGVPISSVSITAGKSVVIISDAYSQSSVVGSTNTSVGSGVEVNGNGSLTCYIDGPVGTNGNSEINSTGTPTSWAGALQIFTNTTSGSTLNGTGTICCCLMTPFASLTANGGGNGNGLIGTFIADTVTSNGHGDFHYDEQLKNVVNGKPWPIKTWHELQTAADRALYATQLNF